MNRAARRASGNRMPLAKRVMYQAQVTAKSADGKEYEIQVGPRIDKKEIPERFCEAINKAVIEGKEKRWRDARVVEVNEIRS